MKTWKLLGNMYVFGNGIESKLIIPITNNLILETKNYEDTFKVELLNFNFIPEGSLGWEDHWLEMGYTKI